MNVYAKQKLEQKESGCGGAATELFKQINQYQRGRKFTARHGTTEGEREREREREREKRRFHREASGRTSLISLK